MKTPSFRFKIALLSATISGLVLLSFGAAAFVIIQRQRIEALDTAIRSLGTRHPGWISKSRNFERLDEHLGFVFGEDFRNRVILRVLDAEDAEPLYSSTGWPEELDGQFDKRVLKDDPDAAPSPEEAEADGRQYRGGRGGGGGGGPGQGRGPGQGQGPGSQIEFTKIPEFLTAVSGESEWRIGFLGTDDITWVIGLNTAEVRNELAQLRNSFLMALPPALFLVGLGGWWIAGRALKPLRVISKTAQSVTAHGLDQRIPPSTADPEIQRLTEVLNRMMDRLEASFHQATRFSADASHELRTPLAIMQGEIENALHDAAPGSREQRVLSGLLEETQRLKSITRSLLLLARADAGQLHPAREAVDLSAMTADLVEDCRILADDAGLGLSADLTPGIRLEADPGLLHTAILNLLVNAVKYNEPGGRIRVELSGENHHARLRVGNTGPGIPEADQAGIFDRFRRVDAARGREADGIGLGLSLAREMVRAHRGSLELAESRNGWTSFELTLPLTDTSDGGLSPDAPRG